MLAKFVVDAKLGENTDSLEGREALQGYLDRCKCWSTTNRMKFNKNKCQILHLGQHNPGCTCRLADKRLACNPAERSPEGFG